MYSITNLDSFCDLLTNTLNSLIKLLLFLKINFKWTLDEDRC